MRQMIRIEQDSTIFNLRAAGIAVDGDWVLLHRSEIDDFWSAPGGRVEIQETASESLSRELLEETGVEVRVGRLLWVAESFFDYSNKRFHEVCFYFSFSLPEGSRLSAKEEQIEGVEEGMKLYFRWFRKRDLDSLPILPVFLIAALQELPEYPVHVVDIDRA